MKIGGIWLKKDKNGKPYMSMGLEFPGMKINAAIFKNEDKQKDSHPDYNVVWSAPKKEGYNNNYNDNNNDINEGKFPV